MSQPMDLSITVRRATREDAASVSACLAAAFAPYRSQYTPGAFEDTALSPEAVQSRMARMTVYVATTPDGVVVGTIASAIYGQPGIDGQRGHLRGMAVLPAWQGHSVADLLLRAAEADLASAGCARLTLNTTIPLQRAIRFYERNGFVATGTVADFFGMPLREFAKTLEFAKTIS
jgi:ribosomal protein S18 acetylase RimI-like enzyme